MICGTCIIMVYYHIIVYYIIYLAFIIACVHTYM